MHRSARIWIRIGNLEEKKNKYLFKDENKTINTVPEDRKSF
jgi:hypothetical protein